MKYVLSAILGAIAFMFYRLFGKRASVRDNGSGVEPIRNSLDNSAKRAESIKAGISDTTEKLDNIARRIDNASRGIDDAIGIVQAIRSRGAKKEADTNS
jgi:hypothetical protein